jgi:hypothetical protein
MIALTINPQGGTTMDKAAMREKKLSQKAKSVIPEEILKELAAKFAAAEIAAYNRRDTMEMERCTELFDLAADLLSRMTIMQIKRFTRQVKRAVVSGINARTGATS